MIFKPPYMKEQFRNFIEINAFGVCTYVGEKFNIATSKIRLYFIYLSFFTFGSPIIIYFFIAFWMNVKQYITYGKRNPLWYK
jgi:phage shock protein PspC (stress-responsive transcriptional regulator)